MAEQLLTALDDGGDPVELRVEDDGRLRVTVGASPASTIEHGVWTVGTSAAPLTGTFPKGVTLRALDTNSAKIWLGGDATITSDGVHGGVWLSPGEPYSPPETWQDFTAIWAIASSAGQKLHYTAGAA